MNFKTFKGICTSVGFDVAEGAYGIIYLSVVLESGKTVTIEVPNTGAEDTIARILLDKSNYNGCTTEETKLIDDALREVLDKMSTKAKSNVKVEIPYKRLMELSQKYGFVFNLAGNDSFYLEMKLKNSENYKSEKMSISSCNEDLKKTAESFDVNFWTIINIDEVKQYSASGLIDVASIVDNARKVKKALVCLADEYSDSNDILPALNEVAQIENISVERKDEYDGRYEKYVFNVNSFINNDVFVFSFYAKVSTEASNLQKLASVGRQLLNQKEVFWAPRFYTANPETVMNDVLDRIHRVGEILINQYDSPRQIERVLER